MIAALIHVHVIEKMVDAKMILEETERISAALQCKVTFNSNLSTFSTQITFA